MAQNPTTGGTNQPLAPASGHTDATSHLRVAQWLTPARPTSDPAVRHRVLLLYDPVCGRRSQARFREALRALVATGCEVAVREIDRAGEVEAYARQASERGFDAIVVAGGRDAVSESVSALVGTAMPLAIVPFTGGRSVAGRKASASVAARLAEAVKAGSPRTIRVGQVANRSFTICAAVGFHASVLPAPGASKTAFSKLRHILSAMVHATRESPRSFSLFVDERIETAAAVLIANDPALAGPLDPDGRRDAGGHRMWIWLCPGAGRWNAVRYAVALSLGRLAQLADVTLLRAHAVSISGPEGGQVLADGAIAGALPAQVRATNFQLYFLS